MLEVLKHTRSICSTCGEIVPATYEVRDQEQVFFTRRCSTHGAVDTDLGYHAAFYRRSFAVENSMITRYGDGGDTDISKGLSPFPLRKPAGLCAGYLEHPFRKIGEMCQEHYEGPTLSCWIHESSAEKERRFDRCRTLLLCCFFSEESEVMKRFCFAA